jgi:hypothetical protein
MVGVTLLKIGFANTSSALLFVTNVSSSTFIITAVPALLLILTVIILAPVGVEAPTTTTICVSDTMLQEATAVVSTTALQLPGEMKLFPVSVTVLPM